MRDNKSEKAITLIALVITIIILLILASVSIATLIGENGLWARAQEAQEKSKYAAAEEKVKLAIAASLDNKAKVNEVNLVENVNKIDGIDPKVEEVTWNQDNTAWELIITVDGYDFLITEKGTVIHLGPMEIVTKIGSENYLLSVNYGKYITGTGKQYKIGANGTWDNYTEEVKVEYNDLVSLQNPDKTLTVYAKVIDTEGNEIILEKTDRTLLPNFPIITIPSNGTPMLTRYGVVIKGDVTIAYDTMEGVTNYYSVDAGQTWQEYVGPITVSGESCIAKAVRKDTGASITTSKVSSYTLLDEMLGSNAYDGNDTTYEIIGTNIKYIEIDSSLEDRDIIIRLANTSANTGLAMDVEFLNHAGEMIEKKTFDALYASKEITTKIPKGTVKIKFTGNYHSVVLNEIQVSNEPTFKTINGYMLLHEDLTKVIKKPYQLITIDYFPTSVKKLYKIGENGQWKNYEDKEIWVNQGETIYAKGIDQYGNETRKTASHTVNVIDALGELACDGNDATYETIGTNTKYINVDSSLEDKNIMIKLRNTSGNSGLSMYAEFLNHAGEMIDKRRFDAVFGSSEVTTKIPKGTVKIKFTGDYYSVVLNEIKNL